MFDVKQCMAISNTPLLLLLLLLLMLLNHPLINISFQVFGNKYAIPDCSTFLCNAKYVLVIHMQSYTRTNPVPGRKLINFLNTSIDFVSPLF